MASVLKSHIFVIWVNKNCFPITREVNSILSCELIMITYLTTKPLYSFIDFEPRLNFLSE